MSSGSRWLLRRCSLELIVYGKACRKVSSAGANSQKSVRCLIPYTQWLQRWFLRKYSREFRVYGKACCKVSSAGENSQKSARCSILIHNDCSVDLSDNILASSKNMSGQHPLAKGCCCQGNKFSKVSSLLSFVYTVTVVLIFKKTFSWAENLWQGNILWRKDIKGCCPATCHFVYNSFSKDPWAKFCVQNDCSIDFGGNLLVSSKVVASFGSSFSRILWHQFTTQCSTDNHDTAGIWECLTRMSHENLLVRSKVVASSFGMRVATISRLLTIIRDFCRISSLL